MTDLLAAIDESTVSNQEYLAFVVGDVLSVKENVKVLPPNFNHMTDFFYSTDVQKKMIGKLNLKGNILAYCIRFDSKELEIPIKKALALRKSRLQSKGIKSRIAYEFAYDVKKMYADFAYSNHTTVDEIIFEVDNNVILGYLKDSGLKFTKKGDAHKIADCIAFANSHGLTVEGKIIEVPNFKETFQQRVFKSLTRGRK